MNHSKFCLCAGSALGLSGVVLGAWGAHGLSAYTGRTDLQAWDTAVQYQLVHALTLLILGLVLRHTNLWVLRAAGWLALAGVILFSGSIYLLMLGGPGWLGPVTPLGGMLMIASWTALLVGFWRWT